MLISDQPIQGNRCGHREIGNLHPADNRSVCYYQQTTPEMRWRICKMLFQSQLASVSAWSLPGLAANVWLPLAVLITTQLYWSMIEMGLCIIAACLPTLRPLFREKTQGILLNSIRNFFSFTSISYSFSKGSLSRKDPSDYHKFSNSSDTHFAQKNSGGDYTGMETHAMRDLEAQG